jgi:hypothetical protein
VSILKFATSMSKGTRTKQPNPPGRRALRDQMTNINLSETRVKGYRKIQTIKTVLVIDPKTKTPVPRQVRKVTLVRDIEEES